MPAASEVSGRRFCSGSNRLILLQLEALSRGQHAMSKHMVTPYWAMQCKLSSTSSPSSGILVNVVVFAAIFLLLSTSLPYHSQNNARQLNYIAAAILLTHKGEMAAAMLTQTKDELAAFLEQGKRDFLAALRENGDLAGWILVMGESDAFTSYIGYAI